MANRSLLSFRHTEMFQQTKEKLGTRRKAEYKLNNITIENGRPWSIEF